METCPECGKKLTEKDILVQYAKDQYFCMDKDVFDAVVAMSKRKNIPIEQFFLEILTGGMVQYIAKSDSLTKSGE
jgi:hypothetical protein